MKAPASRNKFSHVVVIFNPNSTGSGQELAEELRDKLTTYNVELVRTKRAHHAEELAYDFAKKYSRPLIISASGDGGYHEVINGVIRAQQEGAHPTAGLLPAGNANDHYHDVHRVDFAKAVGAGQVQQIDVLSLSSTRKGKPYERYAHSYIGFGMTPQVGAELNKVDLHWYNEIAIVTRVLFALRPIKILIGGKRRAYDSLIFSNVRKMSKVLSLSEKASNDDNAYEVTAFRRRNKPQLIRLLMKASISGLSGSPHRKPYVFETTKNTLVQLDGEVLTLDANSRVIISIEHKILGCIV